jgi:hypothetical protein
VSAINNIVTLGRRVPGATAVYAVGGAATQPCVARPSELGRVWTTGVTFAVANGDLSQHDQVRTTLMNKATFGGGIPPSAHARRT